MLGKQGSGMTDGDGLYVIRDVAPGAYRVRPVLDGFTTGGERTYAEVNVASGEAVQGIDFQLVRAATISGHVLDAAGQPYVGAAVFVERLDASGRTIEKRGLPFLIGEKGEFGFADVQAGAYRISAQTTRAGQPVRTYYFPGTTSAASARVVQVSVGETLASIDIRCGLPDPGFVATGRVVDAASGMPMPNIRITCGAMANDPERAAAPAQVQADAQGHFTITGLRAASYWVAVQNQRSGDLYSRPQFFDVPGSDVRGLELTMLRGVSLSGRFVVQASPTVGPGRVWTGLRLPSGRRQARRDRSLSASGPP
jgi:protocatechuate 3,4-dioxygenase beta subunit